MASTTKVFYMALLVLLAISGQVLSGRDIPNVDAKQPELLHKSDRSFLIPGIGRVLLPPHFSKIRPKKLPHVSIPSYTPSAGRPRYVPGADDTLVPNPGFETPNPGRGHSVPVAAHP